LLGKI
ncbi:Thiamine-binding periplasmic protein precursor, partial [Haemophilus influenzae]